MLAKFEILTGVLACCLSNKIGRLDFEKQIALFVSFDGQYAVYIGDDFISFSFSTAVSVCSCLRKFSLSVGSFNVTEFFSRTFALCFFRPPFLSDILFKN